MLKALLSFIGVEIINWYGGGKTLTFPIFGWLIAFGGARPGGLLLSSDWENTPASTGTRSGSPNGSGNGPRKRKKR